MHCSQLSGHAASGDGQGLRIRRQMYVSGAKTTNQSPPNPKCCSSLCNRMMGSGSSICGQEMLCFPPSPVEGKSTGFVFCTAETQRGWNDSPERKYQAKQGVSPSYSKDQVGIKLLKHPFCFICHKSEKNSSLRKLKWRKAACLAHTWPGGKAEESGCCQSVPACARTLLHALARGEGELFKAGVVSGCWIAFIMVDGRLWYCGKMCSHGNWKLFYPELEWKLKGCLSYGPLLQLFHPTLRARYVWIILIWMQGSCNMRRRRKDNLVSLSCEDAAGNHMMLCGHWGF